ncbi:MAG: porphobilinogen synthase [Spirochaetia bacterium]|nr:porphobilinogen synthase [Spirochaetia bacterium]
MNYPELRLRRLRRNIKIRKALKDVTVLPENLIQPIFIHTGKENEKIESMPGVERIAIKKLSSYLKKIENSGIPSVLIFPIPREEEKDGEASVCTNPNGSPAEIISAAAEYKNLNIMVDLCLCPYTNHGHCGLINESKKEIENDSTLEILGKSAVILSKAGADWVAPSGMMDGMIKYIRNYLDNENLVDTAIMSYSIKFASAFYGPFRDAAHSSPSFSDRKTYQMDYASKKQISLELNQDINEGADAVMVKPALAYLDVIYKIRELCDLPLAAYQVSGEYSMIKMASQKGILEEKEIFKEIMYAQRRAGADWIISYYALDYAENL